MATEFSPRNTESNHDSLSPSELLFVQRRCCFCIPYRWQKVRPSSPDHNFSPTLWSRGIVALKMLREWSELIGGPRWKTFIRRFNRTKSSSRHSIKFQYDPLGYALDFDECPLETCDSETENEHMVRNFLSRYVLRTNISISSKTTTDLCKEAIGPNFL